MRFKVIVGDQVYAIEVPDEMQRDSTEFFARMDSDMAQGWQMSRDYVDKPNRLQRCQIAADKLLTSIINKKEATAMLMAAYILTNMPGAVGVDVDTTGEMQDTEILFI